MLDTHRETYLGATKTLAAIKLNWYWPGMTCLVRELVQEFMVCQCAKALPEKARARNNLYAGQVSAIDLFSPLPQTRSGNKVALVMVDHFTRWWDTIPFPDGREYNGGSGSGRADLCLLPLNESTRPGVGNSTQNCSRHAVSAGVARRPKLHHTDNKAILW